MQTASSILVPGKRYLHALGQQPIFWIYPKMWPWSDMDSNVVNVLCLSSLLTMSLLHQTIHDQASTRALTNLAMIIKETVDALLLADFRLQPLNKKWRRPLMTRNCIA